jgi:hypothetical protein
VTARRYPAESAAVWTREQSALLAAWRQRVAAAQHCHYYLGTRLRRRNLWLGIPVVILSTLVGTSLFATLADPKSIIAPPLRIAVGLVSVLAAVLAATQTFLRFAERSERHAQAGDWFAAIRREIEELEAMPPERRGNPRKVLDGLRRDMNKAGQTYPDIGERVWHRIAPGYGVKEPVDIRELGRWSAGAASSS